MVTETVIDNEIVTMWYYPDKKIIHHQIHKYLYGEQLRTTMETGLELRRFEGHTGAAWSVAGASRAFVGFRKGAAYGGRRRTFAR